MRTNRGIFGSFDLPPIVRKLLVLGFAAAVVGGMACATSAVMHDNNAAAFYRTPILEDSISALGKVDDALAGKMGASHAIAFLGQKNSYVLVEGGEQIMQVATAQLDPGRIDLVIEPGTLYLKDTSIWGKVRLNYKVPPGGTFNDAELAQLNALGFKPAWKDVYSLSVPVKGWTSPPADLAGASGKLQRTRQIAFYRPPTDSPPPDLAKYVKLPFAVIFDVATAPLFLVVVLLVPLNNMH